MNKKLTFLYYEMKVNTLYLLPDPLFLINKEDK